MGDVAHVDVNALVQQQQHGAVSVGHRRPRQRRVPAERSSRRQRDMEHPRLDIRVEPQSVEYGRSDAQRSGSVERVMLSSRLMMDGRGLARSSLCLSVCDRAVCGQDQGQHGKLLHMIVAVPALRLICSMTRTLRHCGHHTVESLTLKQAHLYPSSAVASAPCSMSSVMSAKWPFSAARCIAVTCDRSP